ncbi:hypothetical protein CEXT_605451 [Caerostris extrusa]|uniref:Uncharacterized protein n=1 Tax=Caerostris extrusa TaxID=172846 RepID=A0AAV4VWZ8_CAEEX|nr:hypothetical protein CEXT_605451 [Caerostris extrusa]
MSTRGLRTGFLLSDTERHDSSLLRHFARIPESELPLRFLFVFERQIWREKVSLLSECLRAFLRCRRSLLQRSSGGKKRYI